MSRRRALLFAAMLASAVPAFGDSSLPPDPYSYTQLSDPKQEAEAVALMETIRCLVCQGQSIADSDAELAGDMRAMVRKRIAAGERPEAVRTWLVERYGDWISYRPPLGPETWLLWAAPVLLIGAGAWLASRRLKRKQR